MFVERKKIAPDDHITIKKNIRAFWYPPYDGTQFIMPDGKSYTLVDSKMMKEIGKKYHNGE